MSRNYLSLLNLKGATFEVWVWISNFIPQFTGYVFTYFFMAVINFIYVSKRPHLKINTLQYKYEMDTFIKDFLTSMYQRICVDQGIRYEEDFEENKCLHDGVYLIPFHSELKYYGIWYVWSTSVYFTLAHVSNASLLCIWWRHQMETFSVLLAICAGNSPVPVNSPHKGQWRRALVFSLICAWINGWIHNCEASDLRRHRAHYDVIVTIWIFMKFGVPYLIWIRSLKSAEDVHIKTWTHSVVEHLLEQIKPDPIMGYCPVVSPPTMGT